MSRYHRQELIPGWRQEALKQARVMILGAGALGNEVIKNLVLAGVGRLLIVDFDRIELTNLSRTVLFREIDLGRPKALAAADRATQLNPEVAVQGLDANLFGEVGLGLFRGANLVIGGLDSLAGRQQASLMANLAGRPYLDGGTWALGGEVRWFSPSGRPCFECTLSPEDRLRLTDRLACDSLSTPGPNHEPPLPSTIGSTAVIGGLLAQQAIQYLCGWQIEYGRAAVYNGPTMTMHWTRLPADPNHRCPCPYDDVWELPCRADETTGRDLLLCLGLAESPAAIVELGRDLLLEKICQNCGLKEKALEVIAPGSSIDLACPNCGRLRRKKVLSCLTATDSELDLPLTDLRVPAGEILAVRSGDRLILVELTADVNNIWT